MIYTQEQLEGMSNLELNLIVAESQESGGGSEFDNVMNRELKRSVEHGRTDYCNNWSDCGALIDEINDDMYLTFTCDSASVENGSAGFESKHANNKRAVAIIYTLIKQG